MPGVHPQAPARSPRPVHGQGQRDRGDARAAAAQVLHLLVMPQDAPPFTTPLTNGDRYAEPGASGPGPIAPRALTLLSSTTIFLC